jgi:hypothetical protein
MKQTKKDRQKQKEDEFGVKERSKKKPSRFEPKKSKQC